MSRGKRKGGRQPKRRETFAIEALSKDARRFYDVINKESDLACVIVGGSYLEAILDNLIASRFRACDLTETIVGEHGSTFWGRIELAYALDLIDGNAREDLQRLREIRNRFAHSHLQLTFADPELQSMCEELQGWRISGAPLDVLEPSVRDVLTTTAATRHERARKLFVMAAVFTLNRLLLKGIDLRTPRPSPSAASSTPGTSSPSPAVG